MLDKELFLDLIQEYIGGVFDQGNHELQQQNQQTHHWMVQKRQTSPLLPLVPKEGHVLDLSYPTNITKLSPHLDNVLNHP
jgi:hypothetical protein